MDTKFDVTNRMPVQVSLIDYYSPSKRQTIFYSIDESEDGFEESDETRCSLVLSCDLFQNTEAIVLGYPGEIEEDSIEIKSAVPYKACQGNKFIRSLRATAKFGESVNKECVTPLMNDRSIFLLRYGDDGQMQITGMTSYSSALPKITECFSVITVCPE